jgi:hypothetical protein
MGQRRIAAIGLAGVLVAQLGITSGASGAPVGAPVRRADRLWSVPIGLESIPDAAVSQAAAAEAASGFEDFLQEVASFRCGQAGDPSVSVDMSCNSSTLNQEFGPDNEIAIAVDPADPLHLLAGSNDYFYRYNNDIGKVLATVPTGFFTSFDGGATWTDGQIPRGEGNNAGDPSPAFDVKNGVALMAGLDFTSTPSRSVTKDGNIAVSRSTDGGLTWEPAVVAMNGVGPDTSPSQVFFDKPWLTVDNNPQSPFYGRAYVTASRFLGGPVYQESPIFLTFSDDGGSTWIEAQEIWACHASWTYQESGSGRACDEDQFSIPEVASDGTVYVHFLNGQNEKRWEVPFDFDTQIMVVRSQDGGVTFSRPVPVVQLEDGLSDTPWSIIGRQTVWGHQLRWASAGNLSVNPNDPNDLSIVFSDRGRPNHNATPSCINQIPGAAPDFDPCGAGPGSEVSIYAVSSADGGQTWSPKAEIDGSRAHAWFPWADHLPDGRLVVAWDQDVSRAPSDVFNHVLWVAGQGTEVLSPNPSEGRTSSEQIDVSVTHWSGQYADKPGWPKVCGPRDYRDPPIKNAAGKDCNVFHGDYTGVAVGSDGSINVTWTGLNRHVTGKQLDPFTGSSHDGYAQDAMFARR